MSRYSRHIVLPEVGPKGQQKLSDARVMVVGAGGLGCPALQYLVAAGIGHIGIIDFDVVEESNLQRQVLFGTSSLGKNKAIAARERLMDLNPTISIKAYPIQLDAHNALELLDDYDIILDGTDNFNSRYLINDASILLNKPVVYGAIYKFEGQVSVFNYQNGPSYRCIFPQPPEEGSIANCAEVGVLGVLPGIIGSMQANEVIKIILGFNGVLSGKLMCYDSRNGQTSFIKLKKNEEEFAKIYAQKNDFKRIHRRSSLQCEVSEISPEESMRMNEVLFIDVREPDEKPHLNLDNCIRIPLKFLDERLSELDLSKNMVVFCQSGERSKTAVALLNQNHVGNYFSLKGGATALNERLKLMIK